ncbi:MAG: dihydroxy-acid dehydratase [Deinococcales bacterium]
MIFPTGNLAPEGSVIKATSIDSSRIQEGIFYHKGRARVFCSEREAIQAIKGKSKTHQAIEPGDILVYIGGGPMGTGMEETSQLTSALRYIPWGKEVSILTDARFSGFSTGACIGHIGPEALAGGPIGKLRDGDIIEIILDQTELKGSINLVEVNGKKLNPTEAAQVLAQRERHPDVASHSALPEDTKLWALLQSVSGGTWGGCVFDLAKIEKVLEAGLEALKQS